MDAVEEATVRVVENTPEPTVEERIEEMREERRQVEREASARMVGMIHVEAPDPQALRATILNKAEEVIAGAYQQFRYAMDLLGVVDIKAHEKYRGLDQAFSKAVNEISERM